MHHRAGQRGIGAGPQRQMHVRHRRGAGAVRIDHHQPGATLLPCARDMRHHVDLGGHRVAAPHHDQVGARHLARVRSDEAADAGHPASLADRRADRLGLAGIAHDVAQPVDAVALHQPHRASIVIGPHRFGAMPRRPSRRMPPPRDPAPRPRRSAGTGRTPWGRCAAAVGSDGPDGGSARHSARPWRRSRRRCNCSPPRRAPRRCVCRPALRSREHRWKGNHGAGGIADVTLHGPEPSVRPCGLGKVAAGPGLGDTNMLTRRPCWQARPQRSPAPYVAAAPVPPPRRAPW